MVVELARQWRGYDIIHLHVPDPMACLAIWLVRPKAKLVVHWHSDVVNKGWLLYLFAPLQQWILARADAIITTSGTYSTESRWLGKFKDKIHVVPIGIPDPESDNDEHGVVTAASDDERKFIILAVGRAVEQKGFHVLLEAIADLPAQVEAWIVGDGPYLPALAALAKKLNVEDRVVFQGRVDRTKIGELYRQADLFCLPAVYPESFGVVIVEAMAHCLPVVTTETRPSGSKWINEHGRTGYNVAPGDAQELAGAIKRLLGDDKLRAEMGRNARARFEALFTDRRMVDLTLDLYKKIYPGSRSR
ncbi:hypothetical protein A2G96_18240 [Cupriavidus nantongensis]|uniref:Glycosyl transferase family 1 n=2 Tax=Cupriavidus nantongensis TaxID=1796606 RepID=A0A142JN63_9BURK|nr:hypothetical protein A2G96_18240 [Cupriavidus nantongensis]